MGHNNKADKKIPSHLYGTYRNFIIELKNKIVVSIINTRYKNKNNENVGLPDYKLF